MEPKFVYAVAESLRQHRLDYDPHYRDLADHFASRRGLFNGSDPGNEERTDRGRRINRKLLDSTPVLALRVLKSGMQAGVSSPSRPWFRLQASDRKARNVSSVREWFALAEEATRDLFNACGIYNTLHTGYGDLGTYGTEAALVTDDDEIGLRSLELVPGSYWLGTNEHNEVDTLYREYLLTVKQMVGKFVFKGRRNGTPDWSTVPSYIKEAYDKGDYGGLHEVANFITPRMDRNPRLLTPENKPIASVYWVKGQQGQQANRFALESGFDRNPISASRWDVEGNEVYGRSPGMDALPDAKMLMDLRRDWLELQKRLLRPPMNAHIDLRSNGYSLAHGAINFMADPTKGLTPAYQVNPPSEPMRSTIEDTRDRVWSAMYADLFMMISNLDRRQITAREIDERHEEKLIAVGPVLERLQFEKFTPLIRRAVERLVETGKLPPPPPDVEQAGGLEIEYISLLAQAQKAVATGGIERLWAFAGNVAAAKPEVLDKLDADQTIDRYAEMLGTPPDVVVDDQRVAAIRAERAAAQQAQAEAEALAAAAPAARDFAQAGAVLAEADSPRGAAPGDVLRRLGLQ